MWLKNLTMLPVSVLLPFHNAQKTLVAAVDSVALQEVSFAFEIVLVNNASTDESTEIADALSKKYNNIRILNEPRKGIAFALNTGLKNIHAKYVARMDADDISLPGRLRKQHDFLEQNPEFGLVSGLIRFGESEDHATGFKQYVKQLNAWQTEDDLYRYRFVESPFAHPSVMFRYALITKFGLYTEQPEPEDYELWLRWMQQNVPMKKLDDEVLQWHDSPERLSRSHENYSSEAFDRVRYRYLAEWLKPRLSALPPIYAWGGGKLATRKLKLLESLAGFKTAGIIDLKEKPGSALPHIHFSNIPAPGQIFIISMVSNRGRYREIEDFLTRKGYVPEKDFVLAQ